MIDKPNPILMAFLSGMLTMLNVIASLFFLRFWKTTKDRFFLLFSVAFLVFAIERLLFQVLNLDDDSRPFVFLLRFISFLIIIFAIVDKNRVRD